MKDQFTQDREAACKWAYELLRRTGWCVLDTETTSLNGIAVEISAIAPDGTILFNSLVNPDGEPIHPKARAAHKITDEELASAPKLPEIWPKLREALKPYTTIVTYNAPFDKSILDRHAKRYDLAILPHTWECAMQRYSEFYGDWNDYYGSYRWQPLNGGHRALQDTQAALKRIHEMASHHVPEDGNVVQPGSMLATELLQRLDIILRQVKDRQTSATEAANCLRGALIRISQAYGNREVESIVKELVSITMDITGI